MRYVFLCWSLLVIAIGLAPVTGQETLPAETELAENNIPLERSPDEKAIRAAIASYVDAFNQHDAKLVAAHWTEHGEFVTLAGKVINGRANLEADFAAYFKEAKDAKLELADPTIQMLSPAVAVEHGAALVVASNREPIETDYEAIHVKTAAGWKMDRVREREVIHSKSNYEHLKELEWMVGEWVDTDDEATIETVCQWTKNGNFLTRSFKVYVEDSIDLEGTQVIGYDAAQGTIRSWVFDSDGGFGVGVWSKNGNQWTINGLRVLSDGRRGSATSVIKYVDEDTFTLHTIGRQVDGELLPNIGPMKVQRK